MADYLRRIVSRMEHEDLSLKLQNALLQHHVRLVPVPAISQEESQKSQIYDDPRLSYIQKMLEDESHAEELDKQEPRYQELLTELTAIISTSSSANPLSLTPLPPLPLPATTTAATTTSPSLQSKIVNQEDQNVDAESLLMECAQAVVAHDSSLVDALVSRLTLLCLSQDNPIHRCALYFTNALVARLTGYGAQMHKSMYREQVTRKTVVVQMDLPILRASERFANQTIFEACRGASQVHIIDYGILYGCQWPSLIKAFSERPEGPPRLMITGVDFPEVVDVVRFSGQKLVEYARSCKVTLQVHYIASSSWETEEPRQHLKNEFLIVNCKLRMRHLKEDGVLESPRKLFFRKVVSLRPAMFVQCIVHTDLSSPFFMQRFEAAWRNFSARMELIDEAMKVIDASKVEYLNMFMAKSIMNVVACEGGDRIERLASYRTWDSLAVRAGLEKLAISEEALRMVNTVWTGNPKFTFGMDENWLLLGWEKETMCGMSAWTPQRQYFRW